VSPARTVVDDADAFAEPIQDVSDLRHSPNQTVWTLVLRLFFLFLGGRAGGFLIVEAHEVPT
jgi:hypothetical protein